MPQDTELNETGTETQAIAYKKRLKNWAIARILPDTQQEIVARFRSRSDADGHMRLLRQMTPNSRFLLVFDCQQDEAAV